MLCLCPEGFGETEFKSNGLIYLMTAIAVKLWPAAFSQNYSENPEGAACRQI